MADHCPMCSSPVKRIAGEGAIDRFEPLLLSPAVLAVALDNEATTRAVVPIMTAELRLAVAGVLLEGRFEHEAFFVEQDILDEAEAAARCDGVAAQMRKSGTRFAEAADFREMAARHRKRAMRILALLPEATQKRIQAKLVQPSAAPATSPIEVVSK